MTFDAYAYLDATAAAIDLRVPVEHRDAVAANLTRLKTLARQIMDFEAPADTVPEAPNET